MCLSCGALGLRDTCGVICATAKVGINVRLACPLSVSSIALGTGDGGLVSQCNDMLGALCTWVYAQKSGGLFATVMSGVKRL